MDFTQNEYLAPRTIEKMKNLGASLELPAKQHCQSSPFNSKLSQIGNAVYLAGSSKMVPQDFNFFNCHGC